MKEEIVKIIPVCIEKLGEMDPDRLTRIGKAMRYALPFSVLGGAFYCIYKERMTDKQYEHEEKMLQMEYDHEEKMAEIKEKLLSREEESEREKDN